MYDIGKIKQIPCEDVARQHGVELTKRHDRFWGKIRDEKTASFSINTKNNLWYDFGLRRGGSVIDLEAYLSNIPAKDAIHKLAKEYGIESNIQNSQQRGYRREYRPLTDAQYKTLGIQPERVSQNFAMDLTKHTENQLEQWSQKYRMTVQELAKMNPSLHDRMVTKIAVQTIGRNRLYYDVHLIKLDEALASKAELLQSKDISRVNANDNLIQNYHNAALNTGESINRMIGLLNQAITNGETFDEMRLDVPKDILNIQQKHGEPAISVKDQMVKEYTAFGEGELISHLTEDTLIAMKTVCELFSKSSNIRLKDFDQIYKEMGQELENPNSVYNKQDLKKAFLEAEKVVNGIRTAELAQRNQSMEKSLEAIKSVQTVQLEIA